MQETKKKETLYASPAKHLRAVIQPGKHEEEAGNCDPGNTRGNLSILAPVRFNEIFGLMAWGHRVRKNPSVPSPDVENPRYNGSDTMRGNIQDMQISGAFPIIFGVAGRKRVRKRRGAHVPSICIPPDARFAYGEICIPRAFAAETERRPTGRSKEIRVSVRPPHLRLVFS